GGVKRSCAQADGSALRRDARNGKRRGRGDRRRSILQFPAIAALAIAGSAAAVGKTFARRRNRRSGLLRLRHGWNRRLHRLGRLLLSLLRDDLDASLLKQLTPLARLKDEQAVADRQSLLDLRVRVVHAADG